MLKLAILRGAHKGILVPFTEADEALSLAHTLFMDLTEQRTFQNPQFAKNFWQAFAIADTAKNTQTSTASQHFLCNADGFHFLLLINQDIPTVRDFDNQYIVMTAQEVGFWYRIMGYGIPLVDLGGGLFKLKAAAAASGLKSALV